MPLRQLTSGALGRVDHLKLFVGKLDLPGGGTVQLLALQAEPLGGRRLPLAGDTRAHVCRRRSWEYRRSIVHTTRLAMSSSGDHAPFASIAFRT
jgi:hypothetical protein